MQHQANVKYNKLQGFRQCVKAFGVKSVDPEKEVNTSNPNKSGISNRSKGLTTY